MAKGNFVVTVPTSTSRSLTGVVQNAYRVLGLPSNASMEAIHKEHSAIPKRVRVGVDKPTPWDLSLLGPVERTESTAHEAFARLRDPVQRIKERLLWFADSADLPTNLTPQTTLRVADGLERASRPMSGHHASLLRLIAAIVSDPDFKNQQLWVQVLKGWSRLPHDEPFWKAFCDPEVDFEPRATLEDINEVRSKVLSLLTDPLGSIARQALRNSDFALGRRILGVLQLSAIPATTLNSLAEEVLVPVEDQLETACTEIAESCRELVRGQANASRTLCCEALQRFEAEVNPALDFLEMATSRGSKISSRMRLSAAQCLLRLAVSFASTKDFVQAELLLTRAHQLAQDTNISSRLETELLRVRKSAEQQRQKEQRQASTAGKSAPQSSSQRQFSPASVGDADSEVYVVDIPIGHSLRTPDVCTCCLGLAETEQTVSVVYTRNKTRYTYSLKFPRCEQCEFHHSQFAWVRLAGVVGGALASYIVAILVASITTLSWTFFSALFVSALICPAFCMILPYVIRLIPLTHQHASRSTNVTMTLDLTSHDRVRICFLNREYAYSFAQMNALSVEKKAATRPSREPSIMKGKSAMQVCGTAITAATLAILFLTPGPPPLAQQVGSTSTPSSNLEPTKPISPSPTFMKKQIEDLRLQIQSQEDQINQIDQEMVVLQGRLNGYKRQSDSYEMQARAGLRVDQRAYDEVIRNHNMLIPRYNSLVSERKRLYLQYEDLRNEHNRLVNVYNNR